MEVLWTSFINQSKNRAQCSHNTINQEPHTKWKKSCRVVPEALSQLLPGRKSGQTSSGQGQSKTGPETLFLVALGIKIGSKQLRNSSENCLEEVLLPLPAFAKHAYLSSSQHSLLQVGWNSLTKTIFSHLPLTQCHPADPIHPTHPPQPTKCDKEMKAQTNSTNFHAMDPLKNCRHLAQWKYPQHCGRKWAPKLGRFPEPPKQQHLSVTELLHQAPQE